MNAENLAKKYGLFIGNHPGQMVFIVILITLMGQYGNSLLTMEVQDNSDMIPDTYDAIISLNAIGDEFGSTSSGTIVVEIDVKTPKSNEIRDIRDYRAIEYMDLLCEKVKKTKHVVDATSIADIVVVEGRIPKNEHEIKNKIESNSFSKIYVSDDYTIGLIRMDFHQGAMAEEIYPDISSIIDSTPKPPGIKTSPNGEYSMEVSMKQTMQKDMASTSQASMFGILFVIIMLFRSIRYGLTSLSAIIFGVSWSFGLMGLMGIAITNMTSGAASMIMGIGIDFGIQITSRFRLELKKMGIGKAMGETIKTVAIPMGTTTIAALIGFQAMTMGELSILAEMGTMMSYGTFSCMIAALTIVPVALVWGEKIFNKGKK